MAPGGAGRAGAAGRRLVTVLYDSIRWEEKALANAGPKAGAEVRMVDCRGLAVDLDSGRLPDVRAPGGGGGDGGGGGGGGTVDPSEYGTVLQRCVSYYRNVHSTAAVEGVGGAVINPMMAAILAGNKLYAHTLLSKAGVPTPDAAVAFSAPAALGALGRRGYPAVIKPTVGSWGRMVSKLSGPEAAAGIVAMRESMYPIYHVHYIEELVDRPPRDIRVIMVGDRAAAAIYRYSGDGAWKTNTALGGRAEPCPVSGELEELCIRAKDAVGGQIVGVDLMEDAERGYVVHEVNNTTEFKNTTRVCGVDIAAMMVGYAAGPEAAEAAAAAAAAGPGAGGGGGD